jgi:uncharacterized protein
MNDETKSGLKDTDVEPIVSIFQQNLKITKLVLFGSRAKGTYHTGSDIDLALFGEKLGLNDVLELSIALEKLNLPYMFDLILYKRITETSLLENIHRVGIILYERESISPFS